MVGLTRVRCKALLLEAFLEVWGAVPRGLLPPAALDLRGPELGPGHAAMDASQLAARLSYAELKRLEAGHAKRRAAFMRAPPFDRWVVAPAACEAFMAEG